MRTLELLRCVCGSMLFFMVGCQVNTDSPLSSHWQHDFGIPTDKASDAPTDPERCLMIDMNHDGTHDTVKYFAAGSEECSDVGGNSGSCVILKIRKGNISTSVLLSSDADDAHFTSADFNQDGKADLIVGTRSSSGGTLKVYFSNFLTTINQRNEANIHSDGLAPDVVVSVPSSQWLSSNPLNTAYAAAADINRDGIVDLAILGNKLGEHEQLTAYSDVYLAAGVPQRRSTYDRSSESFWSTPYAEVVPPVEAQVHAYEAFQTIRDLEGTVILGMESCDWDGDQQEDLVVGFKDPREPQNIQIAVYSGRDTGFGYSGEPLYRKSTGSADSILYGYHNQTLPESSMRCTANYLESHNFTAELPRLFR